jgi:fatty-acyl-CoA synthase
MTDFTASYVSGVSDVPLLGHTIGHALDRAAAAWGDRTALISRAQGVRWTWRELRDRADAFAAGLLALGLRRGDRIGIWSLNRAEWALTQFAAARAGLVLVTINPAYRLSELEFALNKVGCAALVTATGFKNSDYIAWSHAGARACHPVPGSCRPPAASAHRDPDRRSAGCRGDSLR